MTYTNGIKEYATMGICYGALMGLCFGLIYQGLLLGIISGILCGVLFSLLMALFVKSMEKKFAKKRAEIASQRRVICDGAATINGNGGWLFLTEKGLEFYPHKANFSKNELFVPIQTIASVQVKRNQIIVANDKGLSAAIIVVHNKEWKAQIDAAVEALKQNEG